MKESDSYFQVQCHAFTALSAYYFMYILNHYISQKLGKKHIFMARQWVCPVLFLIAPPAPGTSATVAALAALAPGAPGTPAAVN